MNRSLYEREFGGKVFPSPLLRARLPILRDVSRNALAPLRIGKARALPGLANSSRIVCGTKAGFFAARSALLHLARRTLFRAGGSEHCRGWNRRFWCSSPENRGPARQIVALHFTPSYHSRATSHGFRATACTILNENGFNRDAIERQFAHSDRNKIRATYNYAEYMPRRIIMMQWWADHLDGLRVALG